MSKRVGISDVARVAGVSVTTVSHALSGQGKVSAQTRGRVVRVAEELGYAPNRIASALRKRRSGIIGLVSDQIVTTPFAGHLVLGAQDAASATGMLLMVVNSDSDPLVELDQIQSLLAQQVDAIVYAKMSHERVDVPAALLAVPTVLVDAFESSDSFAAVVPDEEGIAVTAVGLLLAAGHRRILHLTIEDDTPAKVGRLHGYRRALTEAGIGFDPDLVVAVRVPYGAAATAHLARAAFAEVLEHDRRVTAAFCFNDQLAMGVYQAADAAGLRIPADLSVVGVDDLEIIAANLLPGLTTVALPHYEMGRWAVESAAALAAAPREPEHAVLRVRMPGRLVERDSVARPRSLGDGAGR